MSSRRLANVDQHDAAIEPRRLIRMNAFQRIRSRKRLWSATSRAIGSVWTAENTVIGVAYGLIGIPTQGIGFKHGQLQFKGNLLQSLLSRITTGGNGAIV